jgi:drug/metabolite transporter (DMT)-like permease
MRKAVMAGTVIVSNVVGNLLLKYGMDQTPPLGGDPAAYVAVVFQPFVAAGIGFLILWVLSRMALFSWADLTYALPMMSLGFVLNLAVAVTFLGEPMTRARVAGTACIVAGTLLVGMTRPKA